MAQAQTFCFKGRQLFSSLEPLPAQEARSGWVHVASIGGWKGHSKGPFEFTAAVFKQLVANSQKRQNPIPFDYEHDSFKGDLAGPKPASGFVQRLETRNNGLDLFAFVNWTPRAANLIKAGEYKFCSPVVDFESTDRRTKQPLGAELLSIALTNNPFLDGQTPIQLTRTQSMSAKPQPKPPAAAPAKKTSGGSDLQGSAPVSMEDEVPMTEAPAGDTVSATAEPAEPEAENLQEEVGESVQAPTADDANSLLEMIASAAGTDKATALIALMNAIDVLTNVVSSAPASQQAPTDGEVKPMTETPVSPVKAVKAEKPSFKAMMDARFAAIKADKESSTVKALTERLAKMEKTQAESIEAHVEKLIESGHVLDSQKADAVWAFTADFQRAKSIFSTQQIPFGKMASEEPVVHRDNGPIDMSTLNDIERATVRCMVGTGKTETQAAQLVVGQRGKGN